MIKSINLILIFSLIGSSICASCFKYDSINQMCGDSTLNCSDYAQATNQPTNCFYCVGASAIGYDPDCHHFALDPSKTFCHN